ncbi:MAG: hypothetical protein L0338_28455 [Acidobacteria bacterium]|nr:hypothetical protein [Acidobacteriota bacterium]
MTVKSSSRPNSSGANLERREFVKQVGFLALCGCMSPGFAMVESFSSQSEDVRLVVGALFHPYYRPHDWPILWGRQPERVSLLGAYDSSMATGLATQIIWAKKIGLSYFLALYRPDRPSQDRNLETLFAVAKEHSFPVALCVDQDQPETGGNFANRGSNVKGSEFDTKRLPAQFLFHPAYLRTPSGRPVIAIVDTDGLGSESRLRSRLVGAGIDGALLRIPSSWRWRPRGESDLHMVRAAGENGTYLGFSVDRTTSLPMVKRITTDSGGSAGESIAAMLVCPLREIHGNSKRLTAHLVLPKIQLGSERVTYVILDAFNNWGIAAPLEPSTAVGEAYVSAVSQWSRMLG